MSATEDGLVVDAALLRQVVQAQPFTRWTGLEVVKVEPGFVAIRMRFRPEDMSQHHGFLHGGLVGFLADNVAAYAAATVMGDVVTSSYTINMVSPGVGDGFVARGRVVKAGKRQVTVAMDVYAHKDGAEKLCATGLAVILPARAGSSGAADEAAS